MNIELDNRTMLVTALVILLVLLFAFMMWSLGVESACSRPGIECLIVGG